MRPWTADHGRWSQMRSSETPTLALKQMPHHSYKARELVEAWSPAPLAARPSRHVYDHGQGMPHSYEARGLI